MANDTIIGADLRDDAEGVQAERLLEAFRDLLTINSNARLYLARKRHKLGQFSVLNWIERAGLSNQIGYFPYFDFCDDFPVKKQDCTCWIDDATPDTVFSAAGLQAMAADRSGEKLALFLTSFHPAKQEGNSANMRQWLRHLRGAGYRIHLLYYGIDAMTASAELKERNLLEYDLFVDVPVSTELVNRNQNGLNVHVDDWCGEELLEATNDLVRRYFYDCAVVNYPFISATMTRLPAYTRRILFTHDSFADRNRRMIASGFPESGWVSIDKSGEALACRRADTIVALQPEEAAHYRELIGEDGDIRVVSPIMQGAHRLPRTTGRPLVVGTLGSSNWVNEYNVTEFLKRWAKSDILHREARLLVGGGMSKTLADFATESLMKRVDPLLLGSVEQLFTFFDACDVFVNPERGGTGIKIKTLEAMAFGTPVLSTRAGAVGVGSTSRWHNAENIEELADLVAEVAANPALLAEVEEQTRNTYAAYLALHSNAMVDLIGPLVNGNKLQPRNDRSDRTRMTAPAVSIIVPFYGVEEYIEACLVSILQQDFADLEVILIDDASPDSSRRRVERIADVDDRVRIVTHPVNRGLGPARNTGVAHAMGEYLLFLDSDDLMAEAGSLRTLVAAARRTGAQVVTGSCDYLMPDGSIAPFDRAHDKSMRGCPGKSYQGLEAFHGALYLPGSNYLPVRAWGNLIDRKFYQGLNLKFIATEHEDLAHTPVLFFKANAVYYEPRVIVHYRLRPAGLSKTVWSAAKIERYEKLWSATRDNLRSHGLENSVGDSAIKMADHLMWKLTENGIEAGADETLLATVEFILKDSVGAVNQPSAAQFLDHLVAPSFLGPESQRRAREMISLIPHNLVIKYLADRLQGLGGAIPRSLNLTVSPQVRDVRVTSRLAENDAFAARILQEYEVEAGSDPKSLPAMLTRLDRAIYYHAAKTFTFKGSIVDAGCYVGGTTINLVEGLKNNPRAAEGDVTTRGLIRVYDLFQIDDDYILDHLKRDFPTMDLTGDSSFLPIFQQNLQGRLDYIDLRPGDITLSGYDDTLPIEVFGVDCCKALFITDYVVRHFFPRLMTGALVLQQDFIHEFHPHIHLSMLRLADFFQPYLELRWGGTVAFKLRNPISTEDIVARFGHDGSWYGDVARNGTLLRDLIDEALYDENRWTYMLTLAIYLADNGDDEGARAVYSEARARFPDFDVHPSTLRHLGVVQ